MSADLEPVDRLEIHELYARYTHAYDDGRAVEVAELFSPDGEFHRPGADPVRGRAELVELVEAATTRIPATRHLVTSVVIDPGPSDGTATGTAYIQLVATEDGGRLVTMGRYVDDFVRIDDIWRIRRRRFVPFQGAAASSGPLTTAPRE